MKIFNYCPRCAAGIGPVSDKHIKCEACGFVFYFNPAAAVGVIVHRHDEILLLRRGLDPGRGLLDLPGGFVDPGESALEASRRELYEETALEIDVNRLNFVASHANEYYYKDVLYHTCDMFFSFEVDEFPRFYDRHEIAAIEVLRADAVDYETIAFKSVRFALQKFRTGIIRVD